MLKTRYMKRLMGMALMACLSLTMVAGAGTATMQQAQAAAPVAHTPSSSTAVQRDTLVLKVYFRNAAERDSLATEFGAEEVATTSGFLVLWTDRNAYNELVSRGLRVEIDKAETAKANDPHLFDTFYNGYKTVEEIYAFLDQEVAAHPTLAAKVDYGDSWCKVHPGSCTQPSPYNGYDLFAMHITNQAIPGPKPVFWYEANIHAREIATPEVAMRYISWLLDNYDNDPEAHWLVDYQDIWVVPTANPDGHHIVESGGGGNSPYYQRKNANNTNGCSVWPPSVGSQFGTDNNRNFPFEWNCCGGSSGAACSQTYHGTSGGSDPETQAIMNQVRLLIPDQRGPNINDPAPLTTTGVFQDMHSNASLNLYPWGDRSQATGNGSEFTALGNHIRYTNAYPAGNGYESGQPPNILYAVDGDSIDWGYGELGVPSFTTEVAGSDFLVPYSCIDHGRPTCNDSDPTIRNGVWPDNKGALIYEAKIARTPYLLIHGPDANSVATTPMTVTQGTPADIAGTINFAWTGNNLSQNVGAAEYYIDTPPWAGGTPVAMSGSFNLPTVPVSATIDTTSLSVGRHIIFVRGRGVNDYQGYQTWGPVTAAFLWVEPATGTPTPPTATPTSTATSTATQTSVPTNTATTTPTDTATVPPGSTATSTSTPCAITFTDVLPTDYFYQPVTYLYCHAAVSGYADNTFRPYNNTTRSQLSKIVVLSQGWSIDTTGGPHFTDVPTTHPFYAYVETAYNHHIISGYADNTFHPYDDITRGQLTKVVVLAQGWAITPPSQPTFRDVPVGDAFYGYIETAYAHSVISGYSCGSGCLEFRAGNNATRGQISKIVYLAVTAP